MINYSLKRLFDWDKKQSQMIYCRVDHGTGRIVNSYDESESWKVVVGVIKQLDTIYQHWGGEGKPTYQDIEPCKPDCKNCVLVGKLQVITSDGILVFSLRKQNLKNFKKFLQRCHNVDESSVEDGFLEFGKTVKIYCEKSERWYYNLKFEKPAEGEKSVY